MNAIELCISEVENVQKYAEQIEKWNVSFDRLVADGAAQEKERDVMEGRPVPPPKSSLLGSCHSTSEYLCRILLSIPSPILEDSLLLIPFSFVVHLLRQTTLWLTRRSAGGAAVRAEWLCRCVFFLVQVHLREITSSPSLVPVISDLASCIRNPLNGLYVEEMMDRIYEQR